MEYCLEAAARCVRLVVGVTNPDPSRVSAEPEDPRRSAPDAKPFPYHVRARMVQLMRVYSAWDRRKSQRFSAAGYTVVELATGRTKRVPGTTVRERWRADDD